MKSYGFGLEGVQDANVGIGVEHLVVVVLSVNEFKLEKLKLLPGPFEFVLPLLKQLLQFLDKPHILLLAGPVIEELFEFVVLFLHEPDPLLVLLDHSGKFVLHLLRPLDLLVHHPLDFLLLLPLQLLLPE